MKRVSSKGGQEYAEEHTERPTRCTSLKVSIAENPEAIFELRNTQNVYIFTCSNAFSCWSAGNCGVSSIVVRSRPYSVGGEYEGIRPKAGE